MSNHICVSMPDMAIYDAFRRAVANKHSRFRGALGLELQEAILLWLEKHNVDTSTLDTSKMYREKEAQLEAELSPEQTLPDSEPVGKRVNQIFKGLVGGPKVTQMRTDVRTMYINGWYDPRRFLDSNQLYDEFFKSMGKDRAQERLRNLHTAKLLPEQILACV